MIRQPIGYKISGHTGERIMQFETESGNLHLLAPPFELYAVRTTDWHSTMLPSSIPRSAPASARAVQKQTPSRLFRQITYLCGSQDLHCPRLIVLVDNPRGLSSRQCSLWFWPTDLFQTCVLLASRWDIPIGNYHAEFMSSGRVWTLMCGYMCFDSRSHVSQGELDYH